MHIRDLIAQQGRSVSFEFFPPKTPEAQEQLWQVITQDLAPLKPTFVSVTYGAGGAGREFTLPFVKRLAQETDILTMAHLTTVGMSRDEVKDVVQEIRDSGIENILALRGDPPQGQEHYTPQPNGLKNAIDLITLIHDEHPGHFCVGAAGFPESHPDASSMESNVQYMVKKVNAGVDFILTQFFFEADHYWRLVNMARDLGMPDDVPIIPGIMPVTNVKQIERFAQLSGAGLPVWLTDRLYAVQDDPEAVTQVGIEVATELCSGLLGSGAPGLHFYTLNKSPATRQIYSNLGLA